MSKQQKNSVGGLSPAATGIVFVLALVAGVLLYMFVFGSPDNFEGGNPDNHPKKGNFLGVIYKGGVIVPVLLACVILVFTFFIERLITLSRAAGSGDIAGFVRKIRLSLSNGNVDEAITACDKQKGSVANVVSAGLHKYKEMQSATGLDKDTKVMAIQKEIEEAQSLEMPMLERNLIVFSTLAPVATLIALLGTVIGMIKAFSALANAGAPDSVGLANGISEALINTALGIGTSAVAIIFYNFFTTKIDGMVHGIEEAGYSISQTFASQQK